MGGGGSQATQTQNMAQYPPEFQPLAAAAVQQILRMQSALPFSQFAKAQPQQIAGISPFQQAVANFAPLTLAPSWGLETLQGLGGAIDPFVANAIAVGNQTSPFVNAMRALASGGFGTGQPVFPGGVQDAAQLTAPQINAAAPQPTVIGPGTEGLIAQLMSQLPAPIPSSTPIITPQAIEPTLGMNQPSSVGQAPTQAAPGPRGTSQPGRGLIPAPLFVQNGRSPWGPVNVVYDPNGRAYVNPSNPNMRINT